MFIFSGSTWQLAFSRTSIQPVLPVCSVEWEIWPDIWSNGPTVSQLMVILSGRKCGDGCYWWVWPFDCLLILDIYSIFTRGQFWASGIVGCCLHLCVLCVCPCVCTNHKLVCTTNHHLFKLGSPNFSHRCKTTWLRSLLFWGMIDLNIQG